MSNYKQVIVMRKDLNMRKGKMIAQGCHASMMCLLTGVSTEAEDRLHHWINKSRMAKICVGIDSEAGLLEVEQRAKEFGLEVHVITDAGLTEFGGVPTKTCLAIGPNLSDEIDKVTGLLKLL